MVRIIAIANPVAALGRCMVRWNRLLFWLRRQGMHLETWWTERAGHARELAREAVRARVERLLAVGGDGTVHEVINGVATLIHRVPSVPILGIVPLGRGNDYARTMHIPRQPRAMLRVALSGDPMWVDLGEIEFTTPNGTHGRRYFMNVAGIGFDAIVAARMNRPEVLRSAWRWWVSYLVSILRSITQLQHYRIRARLADRTVECRAFLWVMALGRFFGGGLHIAPMADVRDGIMEVLWGEQFTPMRVLRMLPLVYLGRHLGRPGIVHMRAASLELEADPPAPLEADGEVIGQTPLRVRVWTRALPVATTGSAGADRAGLTPMG